MTPRFKAIFETVTNSKICGFKIPPELANIVRGYKTSEDLLRAGGVPIEVLDRIAFGFSADDIKTLNPSQLNIKWKVDLDNVYHEIKTKGIAPKQWASGVDLRQPIEIAYEHGKFFVEDGHHRYVAAKILNKPLNVVIDIKDNPITKLAPELSYDEFHRCIFNAVHGLK